MKVKDNEGLNTDKSLKERVLNSRRSKKETEKERALSEEEIYNT